MNTGFTSSELEAQIPRMRRYARALTGNREAADDLTQDTLERAWSKRGLWRAGSADASASLRAWLFAVMHNVFVNHLRRVRATESLDADDSAVPEPAAPGNSAESGAAVRDIQSALQRLPDEQRQVVLLVGLEQLSYAETASVLDIPIGTVMSRLSRGRERLRALLGDEFPQSIALSSGASGASAFDAAQPNLRRVK